MSPSRTIEYIKAGTSLGEINCFVGGGIFNKEEKDKMENLEVFSSVILDEKPTTKDTIIYNGETYKVRRFTKTSTAYVIYTEVSRFMKGKR